MDENNHNEFRRIATFEQIAMDVQSQQKDVFRQDVATYELWNYFVFVIVFFIVILLQIDVSQSYHITSAISQAITSEENTGLYTWDDINNSTQMIAWIQQGFMLQLFFTEMDVGRNKTVDEMFRIRTFNKIITPIRLYQRRIQVHDNPSIRFDDFIPTVWDGINLDQGDNEAKDSFGFGDIYNHADHVNNEKGGFYREVSMYPSIDWEAMKIGSSTKWLDGQTTEFGTDFVAYNGHYDLFSYVRVHAEFHPSGWVQKYLKITTFGVDLYKHTLESMARAVLEVILVLMTIFYTILMVVSFRASVFAAKHTQLQLGKCRNWLKLFWDGFIYHAKDFWHWIDLIYISLSYVMIIVWINFISNDFLNDFRDDAEAFADILTQEQFDAKYEFPYTRDEITDGFAELSELYILYRRIVGMNCFFVAVRFIKYLGHFRRINLVYNTILTASSTLLTFIIYLGTTFYAFVWFAYLLLSMKIVEFSDFTNAFTNCMAIVFGDLKIFDQYPTFSERLTLVMVPLTAWFIFFMFGMLVSIIVNAYEEQANKLEAFYRKRKLEKERHKERFVMYRWWDWLRKKWKLFISYCGNCCRKEKLGRSATAKQLNSKSQKRTFEEKFANINYHDALPSDEINIDFLKDSEIKRQRFELHSKIGRRTMQFFAYVIFSALLITMGVLQCQVLLKGQLHQAITETVEHPVFMNNPRRNIDSINTFTDFMDWMTIAFPQILTWKDDTAYINPKNYLVGQNLDGDPLKFEEGPFRLTIRRIELTENKSSFEILEPDIREEQTFDPYYQQNDEDLNLSTREFVGKKTGFVYEYSTDGGYENAGGTILYMAAREDIRSQQSKQLVEDEIFDLSLASFTIDFVVYNGDINSFGHVVLRFVFHSGGNVRVRKDIMASRFELYETPLDWFRFV